eukprot:TRINITY_DN3926_c0_g1_i1.p1 TRINITY_DN3926_c0_g1~~TRINITY_DN3926_c0_g1_i1.p1  ORF type:complete len:702 (-),score=293.47 TRINITY_DN3926_c0_g1_i1:143-2248(-)
MKLFLASLLGGVATVRSAYLVKTQQSPVDQVVTLLGELETKIKADGETEKLAYDKYACWCENTLGEKVKAIEDAKKSIESLQTEILRLKAEVASHGANIEQLKKDIAKNIEAQKEAQAIRTKEHESYTEGATESEQCIGALEAAINVLTGAGTGKKEGGLLSVQRHTMQEAQLLSVVGGIRGLLARPTAAHTLSNDDMELVRQFVDNPEEFMPAKGATAFLSAAEIRNNPFGDYAPQSGRIQGVLKGLYDSFANDLERANAEEALKEKAFRELMEVKENELKTLEASELRQTTDEADKSKALSDSQSELDDTKTQLEADEAFFASTKDNCKAKAGEWAERSRLRTEELHGMAKAVAILSSPDAQATFHNASTTFLQLVSEEDNHPRRKSQGATKAYQKLAMMASKFKSLALAKIAMKLGAGGHFDKVIQAIEKMIIMLNQEEQDDVAHRDRCEKKITENTHAMEDLNYTIDKTKKEIERAEQEVSETQDKLTKIEEKINSTSEQMEEQKQLRVKDSDDFLQAHKDDIEAIKLLDKAISALGAFYSSNQIQMSFIAKREEPAPETWSDSYDTRKSESGGVIAILEMIKEDLEKEIQTARGVEQVAAVNYDTDLNTNRKLLAAQKSTKNELNMQLAELDRKIANKNEFISMRDKDFGAEKKTEEALKADCSWVETHFESRKEKRKTELEGLKEAKNYLMGVEP